MEFGAPHEAAAQHTETPRVDPVASIEVRQMMLQRLDEEHVGANIRQAARTTLAVAVIRTSDEEETEEINAAV